MRQLQNVVFRAITMSDRRTLEAQDLDWAEGSIATDQPGIADNEDWDDAMARYERRLLEQL